MGNLCRSLSLGEFQEISAVETMNSCLPQVQRQTLRKQDTSARKLQTRCCRVDCFVAAVIGNQFLLKIGAKGNYLNPCYGFLSSQVWKEIKQDSYIPDITWQPSMGYTRSHNAVYVFNINSTEKCGSSSRVITKNISCH